MLDNIIKYDGIDIALAGITIVFAGLVLIALTIQLFNYLSTREKKSQNNESKGIVNALKNMGPAIPDDELVAIAAAIECYRKLHFDDFSGQITFRQGHIQNAWRIGSRYGQRFQR